MAQFPGPKPHPVLGHNLLEMQGAGEEVCTACTTLSHAQTAQSWLTRLGGVPQGRILEKIQEWRDKYGPVFRVWYERYMDTHPPTFTTHDAMRRI